MIKREYIQRFRENFGAQIMCSDTYASAKRAFRDALYLSDHTTTRYKELYPIEMKRPKQDITYRDAVAIVPCPEDYCILWAMPTIKSFVHRISSDNQIEFRIQISTCLLDCLIWARIIHTHSKGLLTGKPTENLLCWLFFKYVGLYNNRKDTSSWTTGATYNQILDVLLPCSQRLAITQHFYVQDIRQRNLANVKVRYKKKDGDIYVLKSGSSYARNKHSNSATCRAKYTEEEMSVICDEEIGRNEAARRIKALGYEICPATVTNIRNRLKTTKENRPVRRNTTPEEIGPLGF